MFHKIQACACNNNRHYCTKFVQLRILLKVRLSDLSRLERGSVPSCFMRAATLMKRTSRHFDLIYYLPQKFIIYKVQNSVRGALSAIHFTVSILKKVRAYITTDRSSSEKLLATCSTVHLSAFRVFLSNSITLIELSAIDIFGATWQGDTRSR